VVSRNLTEGAEITLAASRVLEVCSVGYIEGVAMQFQNFSFNDGEVLLQAEVINSVTGTVDLVSAQRAHARVHTASRPIRRLDGRKCTGKRSGIKPITTYALRILDRSDEVRPIAARIRAARRS
jgi:hypothetical protein